MKPDDRFVKQGKDFWAHVRTISQLVGYTDRATKQIRVPSPAQAKAAMHRVGVSSARMLDEKSGQLTEFGQTLAAYFQYRAEALNTFVEPRLMTLPQAKERFTQLRTQLNPSCPLPMNKQQGVKKDFAFFTGIINMLIESHVSGLPVDYDPHTLTSVTTHNQTPLRTLARRVDGAFPSAINPIALWEIKEYYYTTTFGSRVADGVYETLLDGMELEELRAFAEVDIKHYLMVDDHFTWWESGKSYLCRIVDMLHMGYVDEVLFGSEAFERLPGLVAEWVTVARSHPNIANPMSET